MSDVIRCPDCGGVVGATPEEGVKVCQCAISAYHPSSQMIADAEAKVAAEAVASEVAEKVCRVCHMDLSGHRRLKDSLGYICVKCAQAEQDAKEAGLVTCGECNRKLKPAGLIDFHGTKICRKCFADHQELSRFKAPPPKLDGHDTHEKRRLFIMLAIAGVLLLIIILRALGILGT